MSKIVLLIAILCACVAQNLQAANVPALFGGPSPRNYQQLVIATNSPAVDKASQQ